MILIEVTAAVNAAGNTATFYLSTDPFVSTPLDTPANTVFESVLMDPGSFGVHAFGDGRTGGGTQLQTGDITIANSDGRFDAWKDYSFDGRTVVIRSGDPSLGYPASCPIVFSGTIESVDIGWTKASIRLKDRQYVFQAPLLPNTYAGSNVLPAGIEGTTNDIKGQKKPRLYGKAYNMAPPCVNTSLLIFQVSDRAVNAISAVYDRGLALTAGADYATNALLQAATGLTAGTYITCRAEGLFRLASNPTGTITTDAQDGANAAARTAAQILSRMATDAGVLTVSSADVTAMDTANSSELGIWVYDTQTFSAAMDEIALSIGAYYGFDGEGSLRMGVLTAPSGTPVLTLESHQVLSGIERITPSDKAIPPWAVTVKHSKIYTVQDTDIAGAVSNATREFLKNERRSSRSEDATVKDKFILATEITVDTLLADKTGATAATEASRLLTLFKNQPLMFDVPLDLSIIQGASLKMLSVVSLKLDRFGMSAGRSFRVVGTQMELLRNQVILTLWG